MKELLLSSAFVLGFAGTAVAAEHPPASGVQAEAIIQAIDSMDPDAFARLLTDDARFKFGNFPEAQGKPAIRQAQVDFFKSVKGVKHRLIKQWHDKDSIVAQMEVSYVRHDGSKITLPVTDVFEIRDGKLAGTLIYMDVAPLYEPAK